MCVVERDGKVVIIEQSDEIDSLITGLENAVQAVRLSGDKISGLRLRIMELEAQVATLKKIAIDERDEYNDMLQEYCDGEFYTTDDARRQLAEEYPEIFGD